MRTVSPIAPSFGETHDAADSDGAPFGRTVQATVQRPQARHRRRGAARPRPRRLLRPLLVDHRPLPGDHRRRLRGRAQRHPVPQGGGLRVRDRLRRQRPRQDRRRAAARRRRRLSPGRADRPGPHRRAGGDRRPSRQAGGGAAGSRRSGQRAARIRQGGRDAHRPRTQAPAGSRHPPDQQPPAARAGAGQLRPGRRAGAVRAGRHRVGARQRRCPEGPAERGGNARSSSCRRRWPRPSATCPSPSSARPSTA